MENHNAIGCRPCIPGNSSPAPWVRTDALHKEGQDRWGLPCWLETLGPQEKKMAVLLGGLVGREHRMRGAPGRSWAPVRALRGIVPEFLLAQGPNEAPCSGGGWVEGPLSRQHPEAVGLESKGLRHRYIHDWHGAGAGAGRCAGQAVLRLSNSPTSKSGSGPHLPPISCWGRSRQSRKLARQEDFPLGSGHPCFPPLP